MPNITTYLDPASTLVQAKLVSAKRVIETLCELFPLTDESQKTLIFKSLLQREKLGSTAIGKGIAVPHARIPELSAPMISIITLEEGIDYTAPDNKPVDLFISLIVPSEDSSESHLALLRQISQLLKNQDFCQQIRDSHTNQALYTTVLMAPVIHD